MIKRLHSSLFLVRDLAATANFYTVAGFNVEGDEKTVRVVYGDFRLAFMQDDSADINIDDAHAPRGVGIFTYVEVENVDEQYQNLVTAGIVVSSEPKDCPWGKREFVVRDPDGYKIVFYTSITK